MDRGTDVDSNKSVRLHVVDRLITTHYCMGETNEVLLETAEALTQYILNGKEEKQV